MRKILFILASLFLGAAGYANDEARDLFYRAYTKQDKKSAAQLRSKYAANEYASLYVLLEAIPEKFDVQKTKAALKVADELVLRSPNFGDPYFFRAILRFDLATHDDDNERAHAEAMLQDINKANSLGFAKHSPGNLQVVAELMSCFGNYSASNYQLALGHCNAGLKISKDDEDLHRYRALILYNTQDFPSAVKSFNYALKKDPTDTYLLNLRGVSKLQSQDFKGALADANAGKKIDPSMIAFMILSARAKVALGKRRDGCVELQSAAAMGAGTEPHDWFDQLCR